MALLSGSPATDAGNSTNCPAADQRGVTRPQGNGCDIGAYEKESTTLIVTKIADTNDGTCDSDCSLREAIESAPSEGTINFDPSLAGQTITLASTISIYKNLTIDGSDLNPQVEISGGAAVIIFFTGNHTTVAFQSVILKNGKGSVGSGGGAIFAYGSDALNINDVTFINNTSYDGGAILSYLNGTKITITNSEFISNSAQHHGGAIYMKNGDLTLQSSNLVNNTATSTGGAIILVLGETYLLENNTFTSNSATSGGAMSIVSVPGSVILRKNLFSGNTASLNGGAVFEDLDYSTEYLEIENNTFNANQASNGGAVMVGDLVSIKNNTFSGNKASQADGNGGASITLRSPIDTMMSNNILANNTGGRECVISGSGVTTISGANNLVEDGSGPCNTLLSTIIADPMLSPLASDGGFTQTMALGAGSPAIDAGDDANCPATDQRGVTRPQGPQCDIGAYEYVASDSTVNVTIGNSLVDSYVLGPHESIRDSYLGVNAGPVNITNADTVPITAAERVIYKVNNIPTSFSEMMALPESELDTTYWLPWYNNVDLDTQLRFGNVSNTTATVHVSIGDVPMTGSPFILQSGESKRVSFAGINNGPVKIVSNVDIVAAERVIYTINGMPTSFSEMMALPEGELHTTYWLPWYNNVDLDTQLRFGNVSGSTASVQVSIGGVPMAGSPFILQPGESTRVSFAGINDGPVKIESNVDIVAAERVIYTVNNIPTSFSEMMALPEGELNTTYWLPWHNNVDLDTQLRFANLSSTQQATVHVYIGETELQGSPFILQPGESTRQSFAGINNGPVRVESNVSIVVAERVIYKVNNIPTSFSEMMALPNSQLNTTYWLPWYNNVDLDTQLRFGLP